MPWRASAGSSDGDPVGDVTDLDARVTAQGGADLLDVVDPARQGHGPAGLGAGWTASGISPVSASTASMPWTVRILTRGPLAGMTTMGACQVYSAVIRIAAMLVTASSRPRPGDPAGRQQADDRLPGAGPRCGRDRRDMAADHGHAGRHLGKRGEQVIRGNLVRDHLCASGETAHAAATALRSRRPSSPSAAGG